MTVRVGALMLMAVHASAVLGHAQQVPGGQGIIYGPRHVFSVTAPPGWVLDNQAGQVDRLVAVFYREGESWRDGVAVMYVNTVVPDSGHPASPAQVMQDDSARFMREVRGMQVSPAASLHTSDQRVAEVRHFVSEVSGTFEAVAYVAERTVTPVIVLTARSRAAFEQALPAFEALVGSYAFFSSDIRVKPR